MHATKPFKIAAATTAALSLALVTAPAQATTSHGGTHKGIELSFLGRFVTGAVGTGASEITSYDPATRQAFVVNAQAGTVDVLDIRDPHNPRRVTALAAPGANSVAVHKGLVAVAQQADVKTAPGKVTLFEARTGKKLKE